MKSLFRLECAALLLFFAAGAEAANWHAVGVNEKMKIEMDTSSLVKTGNVVTVWDKEIYFRPEQAQPGDFYFKSVKTLSRYGCDSRVVEPLMQVYYAEDGTEIKTVAPGGDGRPGYIVPDSVGEWKFNYACGNRLAEKKKLTKPKKAAQAKANGKVASKKEGDAKPKAAAPAKPQSPVASQAATAKGGPQTASALPTKPAAASPPAQAVPAGHVSTPVRSSSEPVTALETLTKSPSSSKK